MLAVVQYEVYVLAEGRWSLHARYSSDERRQALVDARATEAVTNNPTKVVRDSYFPEINASQENTIYLSPRLKQKSAAAHIAEHYRRKNAESNRQPRQAGPTQRSGGVDFVFRAAVAVGLSLVMATVFTGVLSWILTKSQGYGIAVAPETASTVLVYSYAGMFLFSCYSFFRGRSRLSKMLADLWRAQKQMVLAGQPDPVRTGKPPKVRPKHDRVQSPESLREWEELKIRRGDPDAPLPPMDAAPEGPPAAPEIPPISEVAPDLPPEEEQPKKKRKKHAAAKADDTAQTAEAATGVQPHAPGEDIAAGEENAAIVANDADGTAVFMLEKLITARFVSDIVSPCLGASLPDDPVTRRGVAIYLAGAVSRLAAMTRLGADTETELVEQALCQSGASDASVASFLGEYAKHTAEQANAPLLEAGRTAFENYLKGERNIAEGLTTAVSSWRTALSPRPTELLDIYVLTEIRSGEAATPQAEAAMDLHNGVMRGALAEHQGEEIKHTGKGIFARFGEAGAAVSAAFAVLRRLEAAAGPAVSIAVLGNSTAGEDPSLTPTLSRQAQAILARAGDREILCDSRVHAALLHTLPAENAVLPADRAFPLPVLSLVWRDTSPSASVIGAAHGAANQRFARIG